MTPAINLAKKHKIKFTVHDYIHDVDCDSYGVEAAAKLGVIAERVFKTLIVSLDNTALAVAIVPVANQLSMKRVAKISHSKKATMALKPDVERATGYVLGGVSPLGQKKRLSTFIDSSAGDFSTIFVSAGKRGLEIELSLQDLQKITQAKLADICQ